MTDARIDPTTLPPAVSDLAARLRSAGGRAWVVGGPVRDLLLGVSPRDWDLATDLPPDAVLAVVPEADGRDRRYGSCRVPSPTGVVTVTTLRRDIGCADGRHPDRVDFVREPAIDALRRDFTVNALYLDPEQGRLFDPVGGLADLEARVLRTVGEPAQRFHEDALRLLRAIRFAGRFALQLEAATAAALRSAAATVRALSPERQFAELTDAFTGPGRGRALRLFVASGLAAVLLPEVAAMDGVSQPPEYHPEGDVLTHVCLVLDQVPAGDEVLSWAAVLHDVGKPPTWRLAEDRIRFDGHDTLSARMADEVLRRLHASTFLREQVADICLQHIRFAALPGMRQAKAERWLREPTFAKHLAFHRADCLGSHGDLSIHDFAVRALAALPPLAAPLLHGQDVLDLGVRPGPEVGRLLRAVQARVDEAPAPLARPDALLLLREMVEQSRQEPGASAR